MEKWRLIYAGPLEPSEIHSIYEAIAIAVSKRLVPNTLEICYPKKLYISIGYHQNYEDEIDLERVKTLGIPIIRRQVGGGTVLLDGNQLFYHIIVHKDHPRARVKLKEFFEYFLRPTVRVYRELGLPAEYKPINDVVVRGKKISGNGAALLGDAMVLVGNIILSFDAKLMASILRVPDEKFRDKIVKTMEEWVTSIEKELGYKPSIDEIKKLYIESFEKEIGVELIESDLTEEERSEIRNIKKRLLSEEWLKEFSERVHDFKTVKIREGLFISEALYRSKKTLRVIIVSDGLKIHDIAILGDFFTVPSDFIHKFEKALINVPFDRREILSRITDIYKEGEIPGVSIDDIVNAILKAKPRRI